MLATATLFSSLLGSRAEAPDRDLIAFENVKSPGGISSVESLVRYHFRRGLMVAKEEILTANIGQIRYDIGENHLVDGRYVVTNWGDVVDLETHKQIYKSRGELAGIDSDTDSLKIRVDRTGENGIYNFELRTGQEKLIRKPGIWAIDGVISPNGQFRAVGEGNRIWFYGADGKGVLLGSGFENESSPSCSSFPKPPIVWIDDSRILSQRGNGDLVLVDRTGRIESVVKIPVSDPIACGFELWRDAQDVIFRAGSEHAWIIDVQRKTYSPYVWEQVGNGFEISFHQDAREGRVIRYQGEEIGRLWCDDEALTAPGYISVTYGAVGSNLGYPKGFMVWSADSRKWTTLDADWPGRIIGWATP